MRIIGHSQAHNHIITKGIVANGTESHVHSKRFLTPTAQLVFTYNIITIKLLLRTIKE